MTFQSILSIPTRLQALLERSGLAASVAIAVERYAILLGDGTKELPFFPEYTDHGRAHVNRLLDSASSLIAEPAWEHLSPEDAAVLIISVLLHDIGMHLTPDGLKHLLTRSTHTITGIDAPTWQALFTDFLGEARLWDDRTLYRILGDHNAPSEIQGDLAAVVKHPSDCPNPEKWTPQYRKFLGEFVRRHHARLAHETALWGFPGASPAILEPPFGDAHRDYADLAGFVARSHNMQLRSTFAYLMRRFHGRVTCRSTHPLFLMALLRIADYLELDMRRVNHSMLIVRRLRSPVSREEWDSHLAVHEVRADEEDVEACFVDASPRSPSEFFKLRRVLSAFQSELDTSWAVLGEVFSRQPGLSAFGLRVRRVRSNLDDAEQFMRDAQPPYFPISASLATAGADLLKRLVRPLYGDKPEVGVRELLQNALDAVHERVRLQAGEPSMSIAVSAPHHDYDVLVNLDVDAHGDSWLIITDLGIGMTTDTVCRHFLTAGSSFRHSELWTKTFTRNGHSLVLRSGRFGIGVLATFLLGDRIEVETRHVSAPAENAIAFSVSLAEDKVELRRMHRESAGTSIRIKLSPAAIRELSDGDKWDWYTLKNPRVERRVRGVVVPQRLSLPNPSQTSELSEWRQIQHARFQAIYWRYAYWPRLLCNGIIVGRTDGLLTWSPRWQGWSPWEVPSVSVFDPDGNLPLNLTRDALAQQSYPFDQELLTDLSLDILAFVLLHYPDISSVSTAGRYHLGLLRLEVGLFGSPLYPPFPWLAFCESGFLLRHPWFLKASDARHLLLLFGLEGTKYEALPLNPEDTIIYANCGAAPRTFAEAIGAVLGIPAEGGAILGMRYLSMAEYIPSLRRRQHESGMWIFEVGEVPAESPLLANIAIELRLLDENVSDGILVAEVFLQTELIAAQASTVTEAWREAMGTEPVIPYALRERETRLLGAFAKLGERIKLWQEPKNHGPRSGWLQKRMLAHARGSTGKA